MLLLNTHRDVALLRLYKVLGFTHVPYLPEICFIPLKEMGRQGERRIIPLVLLVPLSPSNNPSHLLAGVGVACFAGVWEAGTWGKTGATPLGAGLNPCPGKG